MQRWLKTLLILVAIFLIPTVWLSISHYYAKRDLERYKSQLRASGEKLAIDDWLPPRVTPENNGAQSFLQASTNVYFDGAIETNRPPAMRRVAPGKAMIGWQQSYILSDYGSAPITNTWEDIEKDLEEYGPRMELLRQAAARPALDFGLDYHSSSLNPIANVARMKGAAALLSSATVFDLHRAETPAAVTNLHAALTIVNHWKNERTLLSQLIRYSSATFATEAQWEILQATNLTDPELAMLQHDWESMEFIQALESAQEMERAREIVSIQDLRTSNNPSAAMNAQSVPANSGGGSSNNSSWSLKNFVRTIARKPSDMLWRTSWSYRDELRALQGHEIMIETLHQVETNGFFKDALAEQKRKFKMLGMSAGSTNWLRHTLNDQFFGVFWGATGSTTGDRIMSLEAARRIVIVAIALKRYQLQHGTWPVDLKTLVPDFLSEVPRDPVDGLPLRYRANADGAFTLYSVGFDGVDNGGDPLPSGSNPYWFRAHDMVWPQPATPEETQQYYNKLQQGPK
jgi:hypothetical protein